MIFIIGGNGFVGSAFTRLCVSRGLEHRIITRDNWAEHAGKPCRLLVNANGNSSKPLAAREPVREFDASVRSVRQSLADLRFDTYLHLSSCDVYPDCTGPATTREDDAAPDPARQSPYGFHKHLAELCVRHAAKQWIILRMGGFVGPGLKKNAIYDLCFGDTLWLDPRSELQFLPTDALADLAMGLVEARAFGEVFNACGMGLVRLSDVTAWTGRAVPVNPGAPVVRYEVSVDKLARRAAIPSSEASVRDFVLAAARERRLAPAPTPIA